MKNRISTGIMIVVLTGIFFILQSVSFAGISYVNDIVIIGNKDVPVDSLTAHDIRSIFLGEMIKWRNNQIIIFVISKTKTHEDFLSKYIGNTAAQYRNYWRKMVFTGKSRSPRSFETDEEILDHVANTSGAIGYIPSGIYSDKVKIISIERETNK
ncbi:substrate-binding domain-containing protein [bacterium]|nr:substrate-binding domain-containing protein [bacterium]